MVNNMYIIIKVNEYVDVDYQYVVILVIFF